MLVMDTVVTRNDWVGRVIDGRFPLLEWLGSTEQAGVFRTQLEEPQARRAVIRILPADGEDAEDHLRDWASAAGLSHPHLMRIYDSGRALVGGVDLLYVITDLAEESLGQVIPERPLSTGEAREMLFPILDALSYLHAQGWVHGHIKPSNVMVVNDHVKLPIDRIQRAGRIAAPGAPLAIHDAPEIAAGALSPASDTWSLGVTLVEALAQHPPLWDVSSKRDPVVPAEIPKPFAEIARACLRVEPAKRASLLEIKDLLNGVGTRQEPANEIDLAAPAEVAGHAHAMADEPRSRNRMGIMAAVVLAFIALVVFLVVRARKFEPPPASPPVQQSAPAATPAPPASPFPQPSSTSRGTIKGAVAQRVMPDVLASANRTIQGKVEVRIRLDVNPNGQVSEARFDARGPSRYFAAKALEAAQKWSFKPAQVDGRPVSSVWALHFEFRRSGTEVKAEQVSP
jgi:TonB family protein